MILVDLHDRLVVLVHVLEDLLVLVVLLAHMDDALHGVVGDVVVLRVLARTVGLETVPVSHDVEPLAESAVWVRYGHETVLVAPRLRLGMNEHVHVLQPLLLTVAVEVVAAHRLSLPADDARVDSGVRHHVRREPGQVHVLRALAGKEVRLARVGQKRFLDGHRLLGLGRWRRFAPVGVGRRRRRSQHGRGTELRPCMQPFLVVCRHLCCLSVSQAVWAKRDRNRDPDRDRDRTGTGPEPERRLLRL